MASIENLEIVVNVDISSALAKLSDLQEELQDLAESIEMVDDRGSEGIDISTTLHGIDAELMDLRADIEQFENTNEIDLDVETGQAYVTGTHKRTIPVEVDLQNEAEEFASLRTKIELFEKTTSVNLDVNFKESNLDNITAVLSNLGSTSVDIPVSLDPETDAVESVKESVSDISADLGLDGMEDGELTVRNMRVAAADVTVIGGDGDGGAEAIADVLSDFSIGEGDDTDLQIDPDSGDVSGATRTVDDVDVDDFDFDFEGATRRGGKLSSFLDETQDLGEVMKNVRKTSADLDAELDGFTKDLGDERSRMMSMEASRAPNTRELFEMLGRDERSVVMPERDTDVDIGDGGGLGERFKRSLSGLSDDIMDARKSIGEFDLRMSDIHNLLATLIPLIVIMIGAIPAVVTAFVGLAAAAGVAAASLAALAGFGALGLGLEDGQFQMENLTEAWNEIRNDFIDAFAPLAERLQPLFEDAIDGLGRFFQVIANQGDALMELTDEARAFGGFIMDFVPMALQSLAALAESLSPILSNIGQAIMDNFQGGMRTLVKLTAEAVPVVAQLVQTIIGALPSIVRIGIQFAWWADKILKVIGVLWRIITLNGALSGAMGHLIALALVAATAFSLLNKQIIAFAIQGMIMAIKSLFRFMVALATASTQMTIFGSTMLANALGSLISFTGGLIQAAIGLMGFSVSAYQAAIAAALFWTAVTVGAAGFLLPLITGMAAEFFNLSNNIDSATKSLKEFDRVAGNTEGKFNPYGGDDPPTPGAGAAGGTSSRGRNSGQTVINVESSGDPDEDRSNAKYVSFRQGRTTGGNN